MTGKYYYYDTHIMYVSNLYSNYLDPTVLLLFNYYIIYHLLNNLITLLYSFHFLQHIQN